MKVLDATRAPERIRGHGEPSGRDAGDHDEQGQHHCSARRVVAEMARRPESKRLTRVGGDLAWRANEVAEPGVAGSDKAPDDPQRDESGDGIAHLDVQPLALVPGHEGEDEQAHEAPVEDPDERIPDADGLAFG